jgi:uncharacterized membrane protein (UPF0127 family)
MKRVVLLFTATALLAGCHIETDAPAPKSHTSPPVKTEDEKPKTTESAKPTKPPKHPDRVYQLEDLNVATIMVNNYEIQAWVMNDEGKRTEGMMFLKPEEVKPNQGMLFVFQSEQEKSNGFWMQNTFTPLDIIYIGVDKRVVSVGKGEPLNSTNVTPMGPYQYVLELKQGGAQKFGIKPGTQIDIPPEVVAEG